VTRKQLIAIAVLVLLAALAAFLLLRSRSNCRRDAHDLAVWAESLRADSSSIYMDKRAAPHLDDAPAFDAPMISNVIEVHRDRVAFADPAHDRDHRVLLEIDADVALTDVAPQLDRALADGLTEAYVVVVRKSKSAEPPRSSVSAQIDEIRASSDPSSKASRFAEIFSKAIDKCPAFKREASRVSAAADDRSRWYVAQLEPSLVDCGCDVDLDDLRTLTFGLFGSYDGLVTTAFPITLDPAGAPMHAATWGDLVPALYKARGTRVHITP